MFPQIPSGTCIFALLDKTAEPLARLIVGRRGSGVVCQSQFQRVRKIVSFASLAREANVKLFLAQKREMVFSFNRQHDAGERNKPNHTHNENHATSRTRNTHGKARIATRYWRPIELQLSADGLPRDCGFSRWKNSSQRFDAKG